MWHNFLYTRTLHQIRFPRFRRNVGTCFIGLFCQPSSLAQFIYITQYIFPHTSSVRLDYVAQSFPYQECNLVWNYGTKLFLKKRDHLLWAHEPFTQVQIVFYFKVL